MRGPLVLRKVSFDRLVITLVALDDISQQFVMHLHDVSSQARFNSGGILTLVTFLVLNLVMDTCDVVVKVNLS